VWPELLLLGSIASIILPQVILSFNLISLPGNRPKMAP
jgi:hypothetical protein